MHHDDILNPEALDLYRANRNGYARFRLYETLLDGAALCSLWHPELNAGRRAHG